MALPKPWTKLFKYDISSDRTGPLEPGGYLDPTRFLPMSSMKKPTINCPADLALGDKVLIHATGAYTTTYSSVGFNSFSAWFASYCI